MVSLITPTELESWLEWAGQRLIAMPGGRVGPKEANGFWPDYSQDRFEIIAFRERIALRVVAPAPNEISLIDEILLLPNLIPAPNKADIGHLRRKIIRKRTLLHPITGRRLFSWMRLAKDLSKDVRFVRSQYELGLVQIADRLPSNTIGVIQARFDAVTA